MVRETIVTTHDPMHLHSFKRICWSAIFAGALVAIGLGFLLHLFGIAIGLTALSMNENGSYAVTIGGFIGIIIGTIASMLVAGYTAGYLGRFYCSRRNLGILYGFVTWSMALLLSTVLAAYASEYVENYVNNLSHTTVGYSTHRTDDSGMRGNIATSTEENNARPVANVKATPESIVWSAFLVFALFFIGAISCCAGALWGMTCPVMDVEVEERVTL